MVTPVRRIFDVKTLAWSAADSNYYSTAASARRGASPVDKRASHADNEYKAHAKQIDVEINGAKALLSNELHREWGTTAAKYRARYLISGLKFVDGTWTSKARALSHRLEDDARRLADRAALATLTTNLRCDG
ncbi:ubiE/COQ5-like methyltransferase [Aureococcus anophagefferens]|nr:ubiE/COQ5-like methyltransferase [Aureococcus anophagefferens]